MLGLMLNPPTVGGSDQQMRMRRPREGKQVEDIGFTIGDSDHLNLRWRQLLGVGQSGEPALTFFLGSLAPMALVLEANGLRVTGPEMVMKQPQRQTIGRKGEGRVQLEATAASRAAYRTEVLGSGMMGEIERCGVLNDEDGCVLPAALDGSLGMRRKDCGRGDVRRVPEAVGSLGSSPGAGCLGHTGRWMSAELSDQGRETTGETPVTEVGILKFAPSPVRSI